MRRFSRHARDSQARLDASTRLLCEELKACHLASAGAGLLRRIDSAAPTEGTKPLFFVTDEDGRKYVVKVADPALMAAEQAATTLRLLGGRPTIPARVAELEIEGVGAMTALLKPFVEIDEDRRLDTDTTSWSSLQRDVVLIEQAWEWFLDNVDTNVGQYALLGPDAYPINIDWDRSYASEATGELSRFAKYKNVIPNARTFLYADFVEGRIDLDFPLLLREAERIRRLPRAEVMNALDRLALVRFDEPERAQTFVARVLERQQRIEGDLRRFVRDLRRERWQLTAPPKTLGDRLENAFTLARDRWQTPLDWVIRGPIGNAGRRLLKLVRASRTESLRRES